MSTVLQEASLIKLPISVTTAKNLSISTTRSINALLRLFAQVASTTTHQFINAETISHALRGTTTTMRR